MKKVLRGVVAVGSILIAGYVIMICVLCYVFGELAEYYEYEYGNGKWRDVR